ncbi:MAG: MBL fold metallo-hydrolase [Thermodesulfobacteriota bacterium]
MDKLKIFFLNVGHGDCAYIDMPNGARMMIDCGCGEDHWPSTLLKHYNVTKDNPVPILEEDRAYGIDELVISHPHGDHIADIKNIRDEIGFYLLSGGYSGFIDKLSADDIDFKKRGKDAANIFFEVVKGHKGGIYEQKKDRVYNARPSCVVKSRRFINYSEGMDLNELSLFVSFSIGGHKVLFTGDMTATGIRKILSSPSAQEFVDFVNGTTVLKVPHHGRENGCSEEMFKLLGGKPIACIASDETLNEKNAGTSNIDWYGKRTSDEDIMVNGRLESRKVFTTRNDKDIACSITTDGDLSFDTNVFSELKNQIYGR